MSRPMPHVFHAYGAMIHHSQDGRAATAAVVNDAGHVIASQTFHWDGKPPASIDDDSNPPAQLQAMRWARRHKEAADEAARAAAAIKKAEKRAAIRQQRAAART